MMVITRKHVWGFGLTEIELYPESSEGCAGYFIFCSMDYSYERNVSQPLQKVGVTVPPCSDTKISNERDHIKYKIKLSHEELLKALNFVIADVVQNQVKNENDVLEYIKEKINTSVNFKQLSKKSLTLLGFNAAILAQKSLADDDEIQVVHVAVANSDLSLQNQLHMIDNIKVATQNYLAWMRTNARGYRGLTRFSHWYHGDSGQQRAQAIADMINDNCSYAEICQAVKEAFQASGKGQHSYSRYLVEAITGQEVLDKVVSDKAFARMKTQIVLDELLEPSLVVHSC